MNRLLFATLWLATECLAVAQLQLPAELGMRIPRELQLLPPEVNLLPGGQFLEANALSPEVYVDEGGGDRRAQIERIDQFLRNRQFVEAIDMLMRLTEEDSTRLVASIGNDPTFPIYVTLDQFVNERIAALAEDAGEARRLYRDRVDPLAKQWFIRALEQRDERLLQRIVAELFNSSQGDDALLVLGEFALEAGDFDRARSYWQATHAELAWAAHQQRLPFDARLLRGEPLASVAKDLSVKPSSAYAYVDSAIPLADVWARLTLVSALEGNMPRAHAECRLLEHAWPDARGRIAGRQVNYAQWLRTLITDSEVAAPTVQAEVWTTFGGNERRNFNVPISTIDISMSPRWQTPLRSLPSGEEQLARAYDLPRERAGESFDRPCSHFPVVTEKLILIQDQGRLRSLDARTGQASWSGREDGVFFTTEAGPQVGIDDQRHPALPRLGQQRFTLSTNDNTLVAVLAESSGRYSAMVGFDLGKEGAVRFGPVEVDDASWSFQGAPVCDANRCWVGLRRRDELAQDYVASYDMNTGSQRWRTRISSAETIGHGTIEELAHQLLTRHEETIYCSTNLGVIAALSAEDGSIRWLTKYPRSGPQRRNLLDEPWHAQRDLTPCLYHHGMIIAAPADCAHIFALDANTGAMIWRTDVAADATQLLGVGDADHLIVSGRRLWWLDVYTGQPSRQVANNPFPAGEFAELRGQGRGVLAAGNVYWPTESNATAEIQVLSQRTGRPTRQPIDLYAAGASAGNLIVAAGHLFIAAHDQLYAFQLENGHVTARVRPSFP